MDYNPDRMRTLSLFSGIGGIEIGLQRWCKTVCYSEIDSYAIKVLKKNISLGYLDEAPILGDIRNIHTKEYLDNAVKKWYIPENGNCYNEKEYIMAGKLKKLTLGQVEECVRMYEQGLSLGPIAKYFNVSRQAMWDLLRRRIALRPQKRCGQENHFARGGQAADDHAQNMVEYAVRKGVIVKKTE